MWKYEHCWRYVFTIKNLVRHHLHPSAGLPYRQTASACQLLMQECDLLVEQAREADSSDSSRAYDDPQWAATARCLRWASSVQCRQWECNITSQHCNPQQNGPLCTGDVQRLRL